jgi:2-hydroxy-6-oxo-6-(2'-aminophenyl)hexa-2,4-dienoate hydrolase
MSNTTLSRLPRKFLGRGAFETSYLEAGSGQPLLLLHDGAPGADAASGWNGTLEAFSGNRRVLAVDMLGFGRSACPSPDEFEYSQNARTRHVIAFIEAAELAPVDLIGNSMGAITALDVAASRPDLAGKVVLVAPAGVRSVLPEAAIPLLAYQGSCEKMREVFEALAAPGFRSDDAIVDYRTRSYEEHSRQRAWHAAMEWIGRQGGLFLRDETIASVEVEVLVIAGKSDPLIPPSVSIRFPELIDRCSCYLAADCGHWVVMERPRLFLELSNAFFGQRLS